MHFPSTPSRPSSSSLPRYAAAAPVTVWAASTRPAQQLSSKTVSGASSFARKSLYLASFLSSSACLCCRPASFSSSLARVFARSSARVFSSFSRQIFASSCSA